MTLVIDYPSCNQLVSNNVFESLRPLPSKFRRLNIDWLPGETWLTMHYILRRDPRAPAQTRSLAIALQSFILYRAVGGVLSSR